MDLFDNRPEHPDHAAEDPPDRVPLAERMRPARLDEIVGQGELLEPGSPLRDAIDGGRIHSMILWGPPGSGKTTLARLIAVLTDHRFMAFSAVLSGIREIREVMTAARNHHPANGGGTILFVDEIHRFNRAQQDAFLPFVERGTIVLVGATTENPSFALNAALLSRCSVHVLKPLEDGEIVNLLKRALTETRGVAGRRLSVGDADLLRIASLAGGDARRALNVLELLALSVPCDDSGCRTADRTAIDRAVQKAPLLYDRAGEEHFNLISALHKSLRNSDADAALYWLIRMLESGEDPLYVARRLIRFASEDIGNADPQALGVALAAREAFETLGMPEGALALAQAAAYLAAADKSNAVYVAYGRIQDDLRNGPVDPVPLSIRNAPTRLMKDLGYGRDYRNAHDLEAGTADLDCLPVRLKGRRYYEPGSAGYERVIAERLRTARENRRRMEPRGRREPASAPLTPRRPDSTPTSG